MGNRNHYLWSTFNRIGTQSIGFIGNVIIARQLSPDDYGLIAMLAIIMGIAWNFTESGFGDCLIRKMDVTKLDYDTIFVYNLVVSLILYSVLYFSAPLIATFFERHELIEITRLLGIAIILNAITITEFTRMMKELKFKNFALIQISSSLISVVVAYLMALEGYGYYSLIFQALTFSLVNIFLITVINKWKPFFHFSWERYRQMKSFSNNMLISYFTNQIGQNLYSVFIGKFQAAVSLGYYNQASKINDANFQSINSVILTTSYPLIAKEKDKSIRKSMYHALLNNFLFIQYGICFFIIGSAFPLIQILFGSKWLTTAPYLILMTIAYLFNPVMTVNANIIKTENRSDLYRNLTFLRNGLSLISLLLTYKYGVEMILIGQIFARYISVIIDVFYCGPQIEFGPIQQLKVITIQLVGPLSACILAYLISKDAGKSIHQIVIFGLVYLFAILLINKLIKNQIQIELFKRMRILCKRSTHLKH